MARPGTRIMFWNPRYRNMPTVHAPALLKLVSVLSLFSIIGAIGYAVVVSLGGVGSGGVDAADAVYLAFLHFILPIIIAYTISTNSPASRSVILIYCFVLYAATVSGKGYLGTLIADPQIRLLVSTATLSFVLFWLLRSPKMRVYYALISGTTIPDDLQPRVEELAGKTWLGNRSRKTFEWIADHLETVVLVGFIVVVAVAFIGTAQ